jgi:Mg2+/Co2+ transporter CorB
VKLSLSLQDHQGLKGFREIRQQAAILDIHMTKERMIDLFAKLRDLARSMDWPLPSEDESQV